ncbi:hypothetical protein AX16_004986 [Volvariella volvacea WC 439]|nr:hypothetical protein AX16_004986 [Volvariella volvacea WC 439]
MAPKKAKKITLNEFLGDSTLGSWADEMDALPSAPAARLDDDQPRTHDRFNNKRDDFHSSRPERNVALLKDDVPLPTRPPYTAFIGNIPFDLIESNLASFFAPLKTKSIKIVKDRDDKPKGFGYVEFEDLQGLKDALEKTGSTLLGRTIRVSVAEPPKERHATEEDTKFEGSWRREGPLPDLKDSSRDPPRRRFDAAPHPPGASDEKDDWRSNRPARSSLPDPEPAPYRKRNPGFPPQETSAADREEVWSIGSKFKPSGSEEAPGPRFGSIRSRHEHPKTESDEGDWRARKPGNSTPPTPQVARRKLDLLPRSGNGSATPSPLSSPKMGPSPTTATKTSPFGAARPVDVTQREKEVLDKIEREREAVKDKLAMSRTNSRSGTERPPHRARTPPPSNSATSTPSSPRPHQSKAIPANLAANVRPSVSFASAASKAADKGGAGLDGQNKASNDITEQGAEISA